MSRSRKKTPIHGHTTARSEKEYKSKANRKLRRLVKSKLKTRREHLPHLREISNIYNFNKDGKSYQNNPEERSLRK